MYSVNNRETFDNKMRSLSDQVLVLGSMVEQAIRQSMTAFRNQDHNLARLIIKGDQIINEKRYSLEGECINLIATQQPMGRDVRFLASIFEIIIELERIGDYAKGIGKITLRINEITGASPIIDRLVQMTDLGLSMLQRSLDALMAGDTNAARQIPLEDDEVDRLYNQVSSELTNLVISDPEKIHISNNLMWAAHNLERLADRVTNICERIIYMTTGEILEMDNSD